MPTRGWKTLLRFAVLLLLGPAACGSVDSPSTDRDARAPTEMGPDGGDASLPASCDLRHPFGTPTPIAAANSANWDSWGTLSRDRLTLYLTSNRSEVDWNLYYATRPDVDSPFAAPAPLPNLSTSERSELNPVLTRDDLTLFFPGMATGSTTTDTYIATRSNVATAFQRPEPLLNVNDTRANDSVSYVNPTASTLYLTSDRAGNPDIYRSTRRGAEAPFDAPQPVGELNDAAAADESAVLTSDELTVFFWSNRQGGAGCWDILVATRSTLDDGFGRPTFVSELNTPNCEGPTWVSPDGCDLLFTSNRPGGSGEFDLWLTSRRSP